MTDDQTNFGRWVDRIIPLAVVVGVALAVVFGSLLIRIQERGVEERVRQETTEALLLEVQGLQECVVDLLLIPVDIRVQLPREDIEAVCPPLLLEVEVDPETVAPEEASVVTPSSSRPAIAPAEPPPREPPAPRPPPAPPDPQPAAPPLPPAPPPDPPAEPPAPPTEPEQGTVPQLLEDVVDTVCALTPALC